MRKSSWSLLCLALVSSSVALALEPQRTPRPRPPSRPTPTPPPPARCPLVQGAFYPGSYVCAQGLTNLTFRVLSLSGTSLRAEFVFRHVPSGAAGRFTLTGSCAPDGTVDLSPEAWIVRPPRYIMVGMHGVATPDGAFSGRMLNPNCGGFSVRRP